MADRRDATCKNIRQTLIPCRLNRRIICRSNKAPSLALPSFVPLDKCHPQYTVEPSDTVISEGCGSRLTRTGLSIPSDAAAVSQDSLEAESRQTSTEPMFSLPFGLMRWMWAHEKCLLAPNCDLSHQAPRLRLRGEGLWHQFS